MLNVSAAVKASFDTVRLLFSAAANRELSVNDCVALLLERIAPHACLEAVSTALSLVLKLSKTELNNRAALSRCPASSVPSKSLLVIANLACKVSSTEAVQATGTFSFFRQIPAIKSAFELEHVDILTFT